MGQKRGGNKNKGNSTLIYTPKGHKLHFLGVDFFLVPMLQRRNERAVTI